MIEARSSAGFPRLAQPIWRGAHRIVHPLVPRVWPFERLGPEVPSGPAIVAANHLSFVDPFFVSVAVGRPMRYLTTEMVMGQYARFDDLINWLGIIPVDVTKVPIRPLRTALAHLAEGGTVGVFPEGRRALQWGEAPVKQGAAWLAMRTGAPVVPISISGSSEAMGDDKKLKRRPIRIVVGKPLETHRFSDRTQLTAAWIDWMDKNHRPVSS